MAEVGALNIRLDADLQNLISNFNAAGRKVEVFGSTVTRQLATIDSRIQSFANKTALSGFTNSLNAVKATLLGLVGGATIQGLQTLIDTIAKIGDVARIAGIGTDELQALRFAISQNGGTADDADAAIVKFSKSLADAKVKGGELADVLKANNVALTDQAGNIRPTSELLSQYADLIANAKTQQDKLFLSSIAFGREAGPAVVQALSQGSAALRQAREDARESIIPAETIARADDLSDRLSAAAAVITAKLAPAAVDLYADFVSVVDAIASISGALGDVAKWMAANIDLAARFAGALAGLKIGGRFGAVGAIAGAAIGAAAPEIGEAVKGALTPPSGHHGVDANGNPLPEGQLGENPNPPLEITVTKFTPRAALPTTIPTHPTGGGRGGGGGSHSGAAADGLKRIQEVTDALQQQLAALTQSDREQFISAQLARAHAEATSKDGHAIAELAAKVYDQKNALKSMEEAANAAGDAIEGAFEGLLLDGNSFEDTLKNLARQFASMALQATLLGKGPLAGLFGSAPAQSGGLGGLFGQLLGLTGIGGPGAATGVAAAAARGAANPALFGPGFATGGTVLGPGGPTSDSVPAMLSAGEFVVNAKAAARHRGILHSINGGADVRRLATGGPVIPAAVMDRVSATPTFALPNVSPKIVASAQRAAARQPPTNVTLEINVSGARGNEEIKAMVAEGVGQGVKAIHKALPRAVPAILVRMQKDRG